MSCSSVKDNSCRGKYTQIVFVEVFQTIPAGKVISFFPDKKMSMPPKRKMSLSSTDTRWFNFIKTKIKKNIKMPLQM